VVKAVPAVITVKPRAKPKKILGGGGTEFGAKLAQNIEFPEPVATLKPALIWDWNRIRSWATKTGLSISI
jgi:hypothetical protein